MSWDELRTRLQQEIGKRLDVALHHAGLQPAPSLLTTADLSAGTFFFSPEELPERISLFRQHLPLEVEGLIREADDICRHRFQLLGYNDLDYGKDKDLDWHLDIVHGKRTTLIPWHKIDFLDFTVAGDHKVTWELNRHQHLLTLAKAWLLTREEPYAQEAIAQWYSWQRTNPYPLGINWASSLEVAFRSISWLWLQRLLADWDHQPSSFAEDLLHALALNGRHIERYLSTYFSPNTHLLGEAVALFFIGTLCPQISVAQKWKKQGWETIQQAALRQVRPDGVYFEQSLYYHVYALDFFLHARVLASRNGMQISSRFDDTLRKMLLVLQALAQVGPPVGFGDDDGGRLFNPRRNRTEHLTDPLSTGAALFGDASLCANAARTEEAIWLFGRAAIPEPSNPETASLSPNSQCFPDGGLYVVASAAPTPQQMLIDAGPQGTGRSGHGHADALSVELSFDNRPWLIDAGTFAYISPGTERQQFRGTRAHNTLTVDGLDQAQPEGPFAWSALPSTRAECWITGNSFTLFEGSHSGYERLAQPVRHRRFVFHLHGGFWLVRDVAEGTGSHLLETSWHFAPAVTVSTCEGNFVASAAVDQPDSTSASHLTLVPVQDAQWKCELLTEDVSPAYGAKTRAPVLRCSARVAVPAEHAMLMIPSTSLTEEVGMFVRTAGQPSGEKSPAAVYSYDPLPISHCIIFGQQKSAPWTFGPWSSDADFLYVCLKNQRVIHLACCEATFVHLHGEPVFTLSAPIQYLEWTDRNGEQHVFSSDEAAARTFSETALAASVLLEAGRSTSKLKDV